MSADRSKVYDLAIVGAGAYGAAIAYESASRGLSTFLTDKGDFGSGTSANSLKIVHGGLRYLQHLDFKRARSSNHERSNFLRVAPSLVRPLQCVIPTGWQRSKGRLVMGAGLALNAAVTFDRNRALPAAQHLPAGGILSRRELARLANGLHMGDVSGGASWFDAIMTDSERLSLSMIMSAREAGASVHNYLAVESLLETGGSVAGLAVRDQLTGKEYEIPASVVVSCQGPWAHAADASPFGNIGGDGLLRAVNLILPNTGLECATGFPPRNDAGRPTSNRLLFAVPWQGRTMVGTWYFPSADNQDRLTVSPQELDTMLLELNSGFENWNFRSTDVLMLHVGQQPLHASSNSDPQPIDAPFIAEGIRYGGLSSAWVVQGEKWTTARLTAQKVVEKIARHSGFKLARSVSSRKPLYTLPGELAGISTANIDEILTYSLRHEMVRTLPDLLLRRTNIGAAGRPPSDEIERISKLAASELGWNEPERRRNVEAVHTHSMYPHA